MEPAPPQTPSKTPRKRIVATPSRSYDLRHPLTPRTVEKETKGTPRKGRSPTPKKVIPVTPASRKSLPVIRIMAFKSESAKDVTVHLGGDHHRRHTTASSTPTRRHSLPTIFVYIPKHQYYTRYSARIRRSMGQREWDWVQPEGTDPIVRHRRRRSIGSSPTSETDTPGKATSTATEHKEGTEEPPGPSPLSTHKPREPATPRAEHHGDPTSSPAPRSPHAHAEPEDEGDGSNSLHKRASVRALAPLDVGTPMAPSAKQAEPLTPQTEAPYTPSQDGTPLTPSGEHSGVWSLVRKVSTALQRFMSRAGESQPGRAPSRATLEDAIMETQRELGVQIQVVDGDAYHAQCQQTPPTPGTAHSGSGTEGEDGAASGTDATGRTPTGGEDGDVHPWDVDPNAPLLFDSLGGLEEHFRGDVGQPEEHPQGDVGQPEESQQAPGQAGEGEDVEAEAAAPPAHPAEGEADEGAHQGAQKKHGLEPTTQGDAAHPILIDETGLALSPPAQQTAKRPRPAMDPVTPPGASPLMQSSVRRTPEGLGLVTPLTTGYRSAMGLTLTPLTPVSKTPLFQGPAPTPMFAQLALARDPATPGTVQGRLRRHHDRAALHMSAMEALAATEFVDPDLVNIEFVGPDGAPMPEEEAQQAIERHRRKRAAAREDAEEAAAADVEAIQDALVSPGRGEQPRRGGLGLSLGFGFVGRVTRSMAAAIKRAGRREREAPASPLPQAAKKRGRVDETPLSPAESFHLSPLQQRIMGKQPQLPAGSPGGAAPLEAEQEQEDTGADVDEIAVEIEPEPEAAAPSPAVPAAESEAAAAAPAEGQLPSESQLAEARDALEAAARKLEQEQAALNEQRESAARALAAEQARIEAAAQEQRATEAEQARIEAERLRLAAEAEAQQAAQAQAQARLEAEAAALAERRAAQEYEERERARQEAQRVEAERVKAEARRVAQVNMVLFTRRTRRMDALEAESHSRADALKVAAHGRMLATRVQAERRAQEALDAATVTRGRPPASG
ncbi:hypothetical protein PAPYR_7266 [Paratrimastix pyriformis]|uniref:Uncharacterized protein n=1 Tax=Paratrimastix pyriformis TaxID=342808 RepID=A0ABQ8UIT2_9EUKA|nr:hypothetical protein PAPYR_7266 [Paratrimastix pyriformis]